MAITTEAIEYSDGSTLLRGQLARENSRTEPRPGVLIAHTWAGCGPFERGRAAEIAKLGYVALAADLYGGGIVGSSTKENAELMSVLLEDRALLQRRMTAALSTLKALESVDADRTAAIGYFEGCACGLARTEIIARRELSRPARPPANRPQIQTRVALPGGKSHGKQESYRRWRRTPLAGRLAVSYGADAASTESARNNAEMGHDLRAADRRSWSSMRQLLRDSFELD